MSIPAQAFAQRSPNDLAPGALFKSRDSWALRVAWSSGGAHQGYLLLEKARAGQLFALRPGMSEAMTLMAPFSWFPAIIAVSDLADGDLQNLALTLTANGPFVVGCDSEESKFDPTYHAFRPDGSSIADYSHHGVGRRCVEWTVELCHSGRPFQSLGTLLSVGTKAT